jgi:hypothetical protein
LKKATPKNDKKIIGIKKTEISTVITRLAGAWLISKITSKKNTAPNKIVKRAMIIRPNLNMERINNFFITINLRLKNVLFS